jgi:hypothetical protein
MRACFAIFQWLTQCRQYESLQRGAWQGSQRPPFGEEPMTPASRAACMDDAMTDPIPLPSRQGGLSEAYSFASAPMSNSSPLMPSEQSWKNTMAALCHLVHDTSGLSSYCGFHRSFSSPGPALDHLVHGLLSWLLRKVAGCTLQEHSQLDEYRTRYSCAPVRSQVWC